MKKDWTYKKLGEVAKVQNGFAFKSNLFRNEGFPIVRISNIQSEEIDTKGIVYFSKKDYDVNFDGFRIFPNDILIAMSGGTSGKIGINQTDNIFYQNQRVGVIREDEKKLNHKYLYYYLHTKSEESLKIAAGAAQPNLSTAQIKNFEIPLPPLSEQSRIVSRLDAAFVEIEGLKAKAEAQLREARTLFQAALTQEMKPKQGWEEKKLGEVAESMADGPFGSNLKKEHYTTNKEVRIIQLSNIGEEGWKEGNTKYTTFKHLETIQRSEVKPGDIVIAKMMPAGRAILCPDKDEKYVLSSDAVRATLKEDFDRRFIMFTINSAYFRKQVYANVSGSGRVRTSLTKLRNCKLSLPPLPVQQSIVSRLDALSEKVRELEETQKKVIAECDALKQALLREVFE